MRQLRCKERVPRFWRWMCGRTRWILRRLYHLHRRRCHHLGGLCPSYSLETTRWAFLNSYIGHINLIPLIPQPFHSQNGGSINLGEGIYHILSSLALNWPFYHPFWITEMASFHSNFLWQLYLFINRSHTFGSIHALSKSTFLTKYLFTRISRANKTRTFAICIAYYEVLPT